MRPHVTQKAHQRRRRNDAVEGSLEKAAAALVGFVGSVGRFPRGTVRRLRRAGDLCGTTISHADSLAAPHRPENTRPRAVLLLVSSGAESAEPRDPGSGDPSD